MNSRAIAFRYAKVVFDLDQNKNTLQQRVKDFESMIKILQDNPNLRNFLKAPQIIFADKKKVLQDSLQESFDPVFMNFIFYLVQKSRILHLSSIADEFRLMVNAYLGLWEADIITAVPLDADSEAKLKEKLEISFKRTIKLNKKIDPQIIGGVILVIGNEMLDWSVKDRLKKLKESLITGVK